MVVRSAGLPVGSGSGSRASGASSNSRPLFTFSKRVSRRRLSGFSMGTMAFLMRTGMMSALAMAVKRCSRSSFCESCLARWRFTPPGLRSICGPRWRFTPPGLRSIIGYGQPWRASPMPESALLRVQFEFNAETF